MFSGHSIDKAKVENTISTKHKLLELEHKIRLEANYSSEVECSIFDEIESLQGMVERGLVEDTGELVTLYTKAQDEIASSKNKLDLTSTTQVANLFFDTLKIPFRGDKFTVRKSVLNTYLTQTDEDGSPKYPVINYYAEWRSAYNLLKKHLEPMTSTDRTNRSSTDRLYSQTNGLKTKDDITMVVRDDAEDFNRIHSSVYECIRQVEELYNRRGWC